MLKFACTDVTKPIHFISSNGIFPGGDDTPYLENSEIDGFVDRMEGGYNQAKWVAEQLVWSGCFSRTAGMHLPSGQHWPPQWYRYGQPE